VINSKCRPVQSVIRRQFFVSNQEEYVAGYVSVKRVYEKSGKGNTKGSMVEPRWKPGPKECVSALLVL
jgi:hypothetical protein